MKTLKFKEFMVKLPSGNNMLETTAGLLFKALEYSPKKGITLKEMGKRMVVIKKLEIADGFIELEDAEMDMMANLFHQVTWTVVSENIVELGKELEKLKAD